MNPKISVIVPVYNAEKTLHKCIDSILGQSYKDWELLLIDDGSTDASATICDEYAQLDNRIRVFHKQNGGVSSARNIGLDNAEGEWITFVDSDDYIVDAVLENILSFHEDIILFSFLIESKNGKIEENILKNQFCTKENISVYLSENIIELIFRVPWSKFFKKKIISELRFDESIPIGEDTIFVLNYLSACKTMRICAGKFYVWRNDLLLYKEKYGLTIEKSTYILFNIYNAYKHLDIKSPSFMKMIYTFYRYLCEDEIKTNTLLWYRNSFVLSVWNEIKYLFPLAYRCKFFLLQYSWGVLFWRIYTRYR